MKTAVIYQIILTKIDKLKKDVARRKRFEPFTKSTPSKMSDAYWRDVWGENMSGYQAERDKFRDNPKHYKHLSSRQLVAHSLGLQTQAKKKNKKPALVYIYGDNEVDSPVKVTKDAIKNHAIEIKEFALSVSGDEVRFEHLTYREWVQSYSLPHTDRLISIYNLI